MAFNFAIWKKALRYKYTTTSIIPSVIGSIIALYHTDKFNFISFILLMVAVTANHLAMNMTDDFFDFLHGVDPLYKINEYSGGSGVLASSIMSPSTMKNAFLFLYIIGIGIGIYFCLKFGIVILLLGLIGIFSSYYYTAPPIKFGYRGFGELAIFFNFGPVITMGAYYVQAQKFSLEAFLISIVIGIFTMCIVNFSEIQDIPTDAKFNKKTLAVKFGKYFIFNLSFLAIILAYLIILIGVYLDLISIFVLITLLSMPMVYKAFVLLKQTINLREIKGNLEIIMSQMLIGILIIASYGMQTIFSNFVYTICIIATLILFILPIILEQKKAL